MGIKLLSFISQFTQNADKDRKLEAEVALL